MGFVQKAHADQFKSLLELDETTVQNAGNLIGFDIDESRDLIIINYTGSAHYTLHEHIGGWTNCLKDIRGLVYEFGNGEPRLVSRGFEKFFNYNEVGETNCDLLRAKHGDKKFVCREKADGHMVEYYVHRGELCASTRGRFGAPSADIANGMLDLSDFQQVEKTLNKKVMSIVVELVHPSTKVFVDYDDAEKLYLLAAYDSDGNKLLLSEIEHICVEMPHTFIAPNSRDMTLDEIISEVNKREVSNHEGWVADFDGQLVKFKYISYIGLMVESRLSYKYIMNCIKNNRLDKMLFTLPEEIRGTAYNMVDIVERAGYDSVMNSDHKLLYKLYSALEGGESYFRTVCRSYFKFLTT